MDLNVRLTSRERERESLSVLLSVQDFISLLFFFACFGDFCFHFHI